jgi:hypothetical protein
MPIGGEKGIGEEVALEIYDSFFCSLPFSESFGSRYFMLSNLQVG